MDRYPSAKSVLVGRDANVVGETVCVSAAGASCRSIVVSSRQREARRAPASQTGRMQTCTSRAFASADSSEPADRLCVRRQ